MKRIMGIVSALLLFLVGCSSQSTEPTPQRDQGHATAPVLKYEVGSNDWSALNVFAPNEHVLEAYQFAVDHPEVLDYMPCYCGCFEDAGHVNNTHCFVDQVEGDVAILDSMGVA